MNLKNGHQRCSPLERAVLTWFEAHPGATAAEAVQAFRRVAPRSIVERLYAKGVLVSGPSSTRANPLYSRAQRDAAFTIAKVFSPESR